MPITTWAHVNTGGRHTHRTATNRGPMVGAHHLAVQQLPEGVEYAHVLDAADAMRGPFTDVLSAAIDELRRAAASGAVYRALSQNDHAAVDAGFDLHRWEQRTASALRPLYTQVAAEAHEKALAQLGAHHAPQGPRRHQAAESAATASGASEGAPTYTYSSVQIDLSGPIAEAITALGQQIPDGELTDDGREDGPHVTVRYGLHTRNPDDVAGAIGDHAAVELRFGRTDVFSNGAHDVLIVRVDGDGLRDLNAQLGIHLAHTDTQRDYQPHATVAYLQPGKGAQYKGIDLLDDERWTAFGVTFSGADGRKQAIPLNPERRAGAEFPIGPIAWPYPTTPEEFLRAISGPGATDTAQREALNAFMRQPVSQHMPSGLLRTLKQRGYLLPVQGANRQQIEAANASWINQRGADLVRQIGDDTRESIKDIILRGSQGELTVDGMAREIRSVVGLTRQQAQYVRSYRDQRAGEGIRPDYVERLTNEYARRWVRYRAQCLPGTTPISGAAIEAVWRRWYEGELIEIRTARGHQLTATPNHPHLTSRGWIAAGEVAEGDDLISDAREQQLTTPSDVDVQRPPATIEEIFDALAIGGVMERRRTAHVDFHGDRSEGDVDVLCPNRVLRQGRFAPIYEPLQHEAFTETDPARLACCARCGRLLSIDQQTCRCGATQLDASLSQVAANERGGNPDGAAERAQRFTGAVAERQGRTVQVSAPATIARTGLRTMDHRDAGSAGAGEDPIWMDVEQLTDGATREAGAVERERVISVKRVWFVGHVYNLSTPYGYFTADGLYTGNTIARTETIAASNRGVQQSWEDAVADDLLDDDEWEQTWIVTPDDRLCDDCADLQDARAAIGDTFTSEEYGQVEGPPLHPRCRCAVGIVRSGSTRKVPELPDRNPEQHPVEYPNGLQPKIPAVAYASESGAGRSQATVRYASELLTALGPKRFGERYHFADVDAEPRDERGRWTDGGGSTETAGPREPDNRSLWTLDTKRRLDPGLADRVFNAADPRPGDHGEHDVQQRMGRTISEEVDRAVQAKVNRLDQKVATADKALQRATEAANRGDAGSAAKLSAAQQAYTAIATERAAFDGEAHARRAELVAQALGQINPLADGRTLLVFSDGKGPEARARAAAGHFPQAYINELNTVGERQGTGVSLLVSEHDPHTGHIAASSYYEPASHSLILGDDSARAATRELSHAVARANPAISESAAAFHAGRAAGTAWAHPSLASNPGGVFAAGMEGVFHDAYHLHDSDRAHYDWTIGALAASRVGGAQITRTAPEQPMTMRPGGGGLDTMAGLGPAGSNFESGFRGRRTAYEVDQARDEHGRWTDGGGGGTAQAPINRGPAGRRVRETSAGLFVPEDTHRRLATDLGARVQDAVREAEGKRDLMLKGQGLDKPQGLSQELQAELITLQYRAEASQAAGHVIAQEVERALAAKVTRLDEKVRAADNALQAAIVKGGDLAKAGDRYDAAMKQAVIYGQTLHEHRVALLVQALGQVTGGMGEKGDGRLAVTTDGSKAAEAALVRIHQAAANIPTSLLAGLNDYSRAEAASRPTQTGAAGPRGERLLIQAPEHGRGVGGRDTHEDTAYFNVTQHAIAMGSGPHGGSRATAQHELGHALEYANPTIRQQGIVFRNERTRGEAEMSMRTATGAMGYGPQETTKVDRFAHPYIGHQGNSEVFSMGVEGVFHNQYDLRAKDYGHYTWTIGVLATTGRGGR